jgi:hypothetical protein
MPPEGGKQTSGWPAAIKKRSKIMDGKIIGRARQALADLKFRRNEPFAETDERGFPGSVHLTLSQ